MVFLLFVSAMWLSLHTPHLQRNATLRHGMKAITANIAPASWLLLCNATQRECMKAPLAHTMSTEWGQQFTANATAHYTPSHGAPVIFATRKCDYSYWCFARLSVTLKRTSKILSLAVINIQVNLIFLARLFVSLRQNQHAMILKLYEKNNARRDIDRIVDILNQGGVIIYPTDTTYAFGCHALKERAIERVCEIKGIDSKRHLLSVVAHDISSVSEYVRIDNDTFRLMRDHLPGPFTFILPAGNRLPKIFKNRKEVGIRIPDNSIVQEICEALGAPLLSTSLKVGEREDIEYMTQPELIDEKWGDRVDLIIDGGEGGTELSTIISCVDGDPEIVRQGKGWL